MTVVSELHRLSTQQYAIFESYKQWTAIVLKSFLVDLVYCDHKILHGLMISSRCPFCNDMITSSPWWNWQQPLPNFVALSSGWLHEIDANVFSFLPTSRLTIQCDTTEKHSQEHNLATKSLWQKLLKTKYWNANLDKQRYNSASVMFHENSFMLYHAVIHPRLKQNGDTRHARNHLKRKGWR